MKISPDSPHYKALRKGLWLEESKNLPERAAMLGVTESEYSAFIREFPFLSVKDCDKVLQSIITWYQMKWIITNIASTSSMSSPSSTTRVPR